MSDASYWICLSVGWDRSRPRGRRWDAVVIAVLPTDGEGEPDPRAMAAERPGRLVVWGLWGPMTGWALVGQHGPDRLVERFASVGISEQGPFRSAVLLGVEAAMRLAIGLTPQDRDPFPKPGDN
jgi:hypothetical protein